MTAAPPPFPPGGATTPAAVRARALGKRYGAASALHALDLEIAAGEWVALLGPNGAGKTTLLRLCALLSRPTSGALFIHGEEPRAADRTALLRRIGLLSHQSFLYDHLTGFENLLFYGRLYGLRRPEQAARDALEAAGLARRGDDLARGYSRGLLQRLAIARTMLHAPDLLLLDEPFTGLDQEATEMLVARLAGLRATGVTALLVSHDFGAIPSLADRILVLASGRLAVDRAAAGIDRIGLEDLVRAAARAGQRGERR
ncbi:MAG TPA: ABC transporter ATP-binding protein [Candidatus Polarisedimenticolia bacterium]